MNGENYRIVSSKTVEGNHVNEQALIQEALGNNGYGYMPGTVDDKEGNRDSNRDSTRILTMLRLEVETEMINTIQIMTDIMMTPVVSTRTISIFTRMAQINYLLNIIIYDSITQANSTIPLSIE